MNCPTLAFSPAGGCEKIRALTTTRSLAVTRSAPKPSAPKSVETAFSYFRVSPAGIVSL